MGWGAVAQWLECRTSTIEKILLVPFQNLGNFVHSKLLQFTRVCINEYLAMDSCGYVNKYSLCSNCSMAECFPEKSSWRWNEQVF